MPPESGVPWCQTIAGPSGTPASTTWRVRPSEVVTFIRRETLAVDRTGAAHRHAAPVLGSMRQPVKRGAARRLGLAVAQTLKRRVARLELPALSVIRIDRRWRPAFSLRADRRSVNFALVVFTTRLPSTNTVTRATPDASLALTLTLSDLATHARRTPATATVGAVVSLAGVAGGAGVGGDGGADTRLPNTSHSCTSLVALPPTSPVFQTVM